MKYFIMTAGSLPEQDYCWWEIVKSEVKSDTDDLSSVGIDKLSDWLDGDPGSVSVLLGRGNADLPSLVLLITELPTDRRDLQRRIIRNSLICIAENELENELENDECIIRQLAATVLVDHQLLARALDAVLTENKTPSTKDSWFSFDDKRWKKFIYKDLANITKQLKKDSKNQQQSEHKLTKLSFRIANDSDDKRKEISAYLLDDLLNDFPDNLKIILIITNFKEPKFYLEHTNNIGIGAVLIGENMNIDIVAPAFNLTKNAGWWEKSGNGSFLSRIPKKVLEKPLSTFSETKNKIMEKLKFW